MNWFGSQKGEGFGYHLLVITIGLVIVLRGSGALSLDRLLSRGRPGIPAEMGTPGQHCGCCQAVPILIPNDLNEYN